MVWKQKYIFFNSFIIRFQKRHFGLTNKNRKMRVVVNTKRKEVNNQFMSVQLTWDYFAPFQQFYSLLKLPDNSTNLRAGCLTVVRLEEEILLTGDLYISREQKSKISPLDCYNLHTKLFYSDVKMCRKMITDKYGSRVVQNALSYICSDDHTEWAEEIAKVLLIRFDVEAMMTYC